VTAIRWHSRRVFWFIAMIASVGLGGISMFAALNRMGANIEKIFRDAKDLSPAAFAEGAYGRITGRAVATGKLLTVPGLEQPCVLFELVVYEGHFDRHSGDGWRVAHREIAGGDFSIEVGDTVVTVHAKQIYVVKAPAHDEPRDLRAKPRYSPATSRVRYVPIGATVQVVGTLTREVDSNPAATQDYREVATRYRLVGARRQPIALAVREQRALPAATS